MRTCRVCSTLLRTFMLMALLCLPRLRATERRTATVVSAESVSVTESADAKETADVEEEASAERIRRAASEARTLTAEKSGARAEMRVSREKTRVTARTKTVSKEASNKSWLLLKSAV